VPAAEPAVAEEASERKRAKTKKQRASSGGVPAAEPAAEEEAAERKRAKKEKERAHSDGAPDAEPTVAGPAAEGERAGKPKTSSIATRRRRRPGQHLCRRRSSKHQATRWINWRTL
jgi:hypothetical protein